MPYCFQVLIDVLEGCQSGTGGLVGLGATLTSSPNGPDRGCKLASQPHIRVDASSLSMLAHVHSMFSIEHHGLVHSPLLVRRSPPSTVVAAGLRRGAATPEGSRLVGTSVHYDAPESRRLGRQRQLRSAEQCYCCRRGGAGGKPGRARQPNGTIAASEHPVHTHCAPRSKSLSPGLRPSRRASSN